MSIRADLVPPDGALSAESIVTEAEAGAVMGLTHGSSDVPLASNDGLPSKLVGSDGVAVGVGVGVPADTTDNVTEYVPTLTGMRRNQYGPLTPSGRVWTVFGDCICPVMRDKPF